LATQFAVPQALVHAEATPEVSSTRAGEQYTPMVASVLSTPRWFAGSDGQAHLALGMRVLNAFSVDVKLTEPTVLDGGNQTRSDVPWRRSRRDLLVVQLARNCRGNLVRIRQRHAWLDTPFVSPGGLQTTLAHRLTVSVPPKLPASSSIHERMGLATVDLRPPPVVSAPLLAHSGRQWGAAATARNAVLCSRQMTTSTWRSDSP
jgi:hypothetical protein